jgi:hypothetical protein
MRRLCVPLKVGQAEPEKPHRAARLQKAFYQMQAWHATGKGMALRDLAMAYKEPVTVATLAVIL